MSPVEILIRMKENLMVRGWCQHVLENDYGNVCLAGSMLTLPEYYTEIINTEAAKNVAAAINSRINDLCIPWWNDTDGRTFNEVIGLIDEVIVSEKEKEGEGR